MEKKGNYISRVLKTIVSFTISYAFVVIMYVLISEIGVFDPIDNQKAILHQFTLIISELSVG